MSGPKFYYVSQFCIELQIATYYFVNYNNLLNETKDKINIVNNNYGLLETA